MASGFGRRPSTCCLHRRRSSDYRYGLADYRYGLAIGRERGIVMAAGRVLGGRYQTEQLLGSGGMAAVWRGRDLRLDRPVAIKELAGAGLGEPMAAERFDREARTVARLAHPNIVAVYDFGTEDGSSYLVMELVEGQTVAAMLADGPLPLVQAVAIAAQTCDGLAAAHAAGIIHRDVKPANLILGPTGVVKICDFGIARLLYATGHTSLTGPAVAMGSSQYMAPEQVNREPVDARADLYAVGCTLYAMLAGAPPFGGDDAISVLQQHLTQPPAPLRQRRADVPPALDALVGELLAKAPATRPADATRVRARLAALLEDPAIATASVAVPRPAAVPEAAAAVAGPPAPRTDAQLTPFPGAGGPVSLDGPSDTCPTRRGWRLAAVAGAILIAAILIPLLAASRSLPTGAGGPPTASGTPFSAAASPSVSAQPTAIARSTAPIEPSSSTQPAETVQRSAPARSTDPIAAVRLSIQQQVSTGNLNPDVAKDLYKKVDEIAREMNASDVKDAANRLQDFRAKLADLLEQGKLTAAGHDALTRDLDRLAAALS
jgi:eukaryotic-like serine/threonine-protein kinase